MGCDIHIVVEVKKNGKWEYVPEVPENFDQRNYGVFAALADVRNSFNIKGFKPKGLPEDISARKFGFKSYTENATKRFYSDDDGRIMFIAEDGTVKDPHDIEKEHLTEEKYEELNKLMKENQEAFDRQYYMLGWSCSKNVKDYYVYNAYLYNGHFEKTPHYKYFSTVEDFLKDYYEDDWDEEMQDYGSWDVEFDCCDYHSASYLSLKELIEKDFTDYYSNKYKMDVSFYDAFTKRGGKLPDGMRVEEFKPQELSDIFMTAFSPVVMVVWEKDEEEKQKTGLYKGIEELKEIAQKYQIDNPEDIRIVFAFDN